MVQDILERTHLQLSLRIEKMHNILVYSVGTTYSCVHSLVFNIYKSKQENVRNYRNVWQIFCKILYQLQELALDNFHQDSNHGAILNS